MQHNREARQKPMPLQSVEFEQRHQKHTMKKRQSLQLNDVENTVFLYRRMKLDSYFIPYTMVNSKWFKNISIRPKVIKPLKEKIGGKFWIWL